MTMIHTSTGEFAALLAAQANPVSVLLKPDAPANDPRAVRTWAGVMAIVAASASPVVIWIDCTTSGPYTIPAGSYEMARAWLVGAKLGNPEENKLRAPDGVKLRNLGGLASSVWLDAFPSTAPTFAFDTVSPAQPPVLGLVLGATVKNSGSRALADVAGGGGPGLILGLLIGGSVESTSSAPFMALAPGAVALVSAFAPGSNPANLISGDATTAVQIIGTSGVQTPLSVGFAGSFSYGPSNAAWSGDTAHRPTFNAGDCPGFSYFDSTIGKPVWWTGAAWVDSAGAPA